MDTRSGEQKVFELTRKLNFWHKAVVLLRQHYPRRLQPCFTLWTLEDMDRITYYLNEKKPATAVVVGGGFIGLEW